LHAGENNETAFTLKKRTDEYGNVSTGEIFGKLRNGKFIPFDGVNNFKITSFDDMVHHAVELKYQGNIITAWRYLR